ncbi:sugar transferase [Mangrovimonas sp. YM274]|uniref:sugar transferase n=1 Tax=Mangrovimonas sp. YM274 TaxID=3070660 RepID=UPI0027DD0E35|nr:sugar transferase [Mangrovimonas sp. YM274]WMI67263.1 sugar transferase [Mangrovimonas sp. YM274]
MVKTQLLYSKFIKTIIDLVLAVFGVLMLSPIFFVILILLWFSNKGKVFFYQDRPGKNERIFKIIKFKTMNDKTDAQGQLLPPIERLTKTGMFLRKYSLDEIPQLINVIKGDMSLIGPRPLHVRYLPLYNDFQKHRHDVKPGITGWAQINGRNSISWEEKFNYDVWYVRNISLWLDLKILIGTFLKIFKKEGIYSPENDIVPDFTGTLQKENSY